MSLAAFFGHHDAGRLPELLPLRYQRMQADAFAFFRGSAPWYYETIIPTTRLPASPLAWLCADAHVENFGSYRGDNGLVYFDLNDFDEALRGPLLWDVARLAVSVILAGVHIGLTLAQQQAAVRELLTTYARTLTTGKSFLLERDTATGVVRQLLQSVAKRRRRTLLGKLANSRHGWHFRTYPTLLALGAKEQKTILTGFEAWRRAQVTPPCGPVLAVAQRIAGVGSLGVPRYALLAQHRTPHKLPVLLDLKLALPPAAQRVGLSQPHWLSEAHRVVQTQFWLQAVPPALLQTVELGGQPFVLRALQPVADKLDFSHTAHSKASFRAALPDFAQLLAWAHLRAAGRHGAAIPDTLQAFGSTPTAWLEEVVEFAEQASVQVNKDFHVFRAACKQKLLPTATKPLARK